MKPIAAHGALAALCALVSAAAFAAEDALVPHDFAWGREVDAQRGSPLQTLLLDLPIYRGSVGPGLADLRVWNGAGEIVPHAIRPLVDPSEQKGALVSVPLFRVPEGSALARNPVGSVRERDVDIEVAADGAIVRVSTDRPPADAGRQPPSAYLIDLSQLAEQERAVEALSLTLAPEPAEFAMALRAEATDDLVHFEPIAARAAVARLDQAGHRIEQSEVAFRAITRRYLLLSGAQALPVEVTAVRARLAPVIDPPPRQRERIPGERAPDERSGYGEYVFDLGGAIPVDRVQVDLPAANTVVEAELYSASEASGPWLHHFSGVLYQLDHRDGALRNAEIAVPAIRMRYFKLAVAEKGGGLGGGVPALEVAWMPEQLLFVARGSGPFALGYGRAQVEGSRFDAAELIDSALPPGADPRRDLPRETATLGPVRAVGDPSVLEPRREPPAAKTVALWGVLVGSVAIVVALSVRLLRRIGPT